MSTAKVSYAYASGSSNTVRRTGATYPNGRQVGYLCDYPAGDKLSRISSIIEGAPADGLRAFWKLDEDVSSGSRSDSADANTLADSSSNVGTGTGLFGGKAAKLTLSPTSVLALGATPNLSFGKQDFTTSGWIKFNSFSATDSTTGVWGKGNAGNANPLVEEWTLYVLNSNKHLHWLLSNGSTYVDVDLNVVLTTGTWYFICAWYDATLERAYVQVNTTSTYQSYTAGPSDQGYGFTVGRTVDHYLDGLVQNIGVWDRLLTSAEKTALYNSGSGVKFYNQARYSYLGTSAPVIVDYATPQVQYTLATGSGASLYAGLDRFGRVIDCRWQTLASSPTDVARLKYGYDRASNRTYREDPVAKAQSTPKYFDELYAYDGLYRLTGMQRGQLTGTPPSGITNKNFAQGWTLDPTGNWQGFTEAATGGSNTLVQTRTANPANEITDITNTTGSAWSQAGYDAAGNMVAIPKPATPTEGFTGVYDAWNRLVRVLDADTNATVQENAYDGLTRRTVQKTYSSGTLSETRHYYYSDAWRVLEERLGTSPDSAAADRQFVWGLRYIDDLVLRDRSVSGGTLNERLYALQDANWNVVAICNTSGTVQERFAYSPYGVPLFLTAAFVAHSSAFNWETLFCGYRYNASTELYQVRYRALNSVLGRWLSRDPAATHIRGDSLYAYVRNMPIGYVDPSGLQEQPSFLPRALKVGRLGKRTRRTVEKEGNYWTLEQWAFEQGTRNVRVIKDCTVLVELIRFDQRAITWDNPVITRDPDRSTSCGAGSYGTLSCWASFFNDPADPGLIANFPDIKGVLGIGREYGFLAAFLVNFQKELSLSLQDQDYNAGRGVDLGPGKEGAGRFKAVLDEAWDLAWFQGMSMLMSTHKRLMCADDPSHGSRYWYEDVPCCDEVEIVFRCAHYNIKQNQSEVPNFDIKTGKGYCNRGMRLSYGVDGRLIERPFVADFAERPVKK